MNSSIALQRIPFLQRAWNVLVSPREEWARIAAEPATVPSLYMEYAAPLVGLAAAVSFLQRWLIGTWVPFAGHVQAGMIVALEGGVASFVFGLVGLFVAALIVCLLAPPFGAKRDLTQALKAAVYAATPGCIASVFSLLPALGTLIGLAMMLYGIYVLYLGLVPVMSTPKERAAGYTAAIVVVGILLGLLLGALGAAVGGSGRGAALGAFGASQTRAERRQSAAESVGNAVGGMLGTDKQGKAQLSAAIDNLAKAGEQGDAANSGNANSATAASSGGNASPQNAAAAATGLLSALGGALGGSHRVDPVDFNTLKQMLPVSLPGLQRGSAKGSNKEGFGMKAASASAVYSGPAERRVEISIADASAVSELMDLASALPHQTSGSGDTSMERDATVAGYPAHEKFNTQSQHGEITFLLAKRFDVELVGEHVDLSTLEGYAGSIDLSHLVAMKDAGAHAN
jgi:hypothetical protein